ncbi:MAG: hypothetical protein KIS94_10710 [Chitinophagales bacterium]|nr:hypothetical protein [Chitinophagales bacterium]
MRGTVLVVLLFFTASFNVHCPAVVIADAAKQHWVSGAPGGRSGTNYTVKLLIKTSAKIEITHWWIGQEEVPFNLELYNGTQPRKGDTVLLTYNRIHNEQPSDFTSTPAPLAYKGAALLECLVNGKLNYYTVNAFRNEKELRGE